MGRARTRAERTARDRVPVDLMDTGTAERAQHGVRMVARYTQSGVFKGYSAMAKTPDVIAWYWQRMLLTAPQVRAAQRFEELWLAAYGSGAVTSGYGLRPPGAGDGPAAAADAVAEIQGLAKEIGRRHGINAYYALRAACGCGEYVGDDEVGILGLLKRALSTAVDWWGLSQDDEIDDGILEPRDEVEKSA